MSHYNKMNNNQNHKKGKHIKKEKKKQLQPKEEERTNVFQQGFVDLISYSESPSAQQQMQAQHCQNNRQPEKAQKKDIIWPRLPASVSKAQSLMIIGPKNTGKSTLCNHLQSNNRDVVLLDCDIGKNASIDGCVSLIFGQQIKRIWIGQLTPVNNLQTYLRAIRYLHACYRNIWFGKRLVVNTMGYTTGLGEFLLYQIYHIIKPKMVFVLKPPQMNQYDPINKIIANLSNGKYTQKIHLSRNPQEEIHVTSTKIEAYDNKEAVPKKGGARFQRCFGSVSHLIDLVQLIRSSQSPFGEKKLEVCQRKDILVFEQRKHKKEEFQGVERVMYIPVPIDESIDMRLIVLGKILEGPANLLDSWNTAESQAAGLFEVEGLGFCFQGRIYSKVNMNGLAGVVSQGIDFEKGFYHLNEKQLIDLELRWGRMSYLLVSTKTLGSKGVRNNPSKAI